MSDRLIFTRGMGISYPNIARPDTKLAIFHTMRAKSAVVGGLTGQDVDFSCRAVLGYAPSKRWRDRLLLEYQRWSVAVSMWDDLSQWSLYIKRSKLPRKGDLFNEATRSTEAENG